MEEFRLQYPLTAHAIVLDAGAFRGDFIDWCRKRWNCSAVAFEPCAEFADATERRFSGDDKVRLLRYGLSDRTEQVPLAIRGDSTSVFGIHEGATTETAALRDVVEVFADLNLRLVDLFKINIEGGEYPLLERMIEAGLVARVRYFQIQFHGIGVADPGAVRDRIRSALRATHDEEWCVNGGQWESWGRRV